MNTFIGKLFRENKKFLVITFLILLAVALQSFLYYRFGHKLVEAMYNGRSIAILNNIIQRQSNFPLNNYFKLADRVSIFLNIYLIIGLIFLLLLIKQHANLILILLGINAAALILFSTSRVGIGLNLDSLFYISCARNLLAGKGYQITHAGYPLTLWPPLFPTLLAVIELARVNVINGIRFLNAFIFALIIFLSGCLFLKCIRPKPLAVLALTSVLFSGSLLSIFIMACSEPLFTLLILLFAICISHFLEQRALSALILASLFTASAILQRYPGIAVLLTGLLLIFFFMPAGISLGKRSRYAALFSTISIIPIGIWSIRNYILTSSLVSPRGPSSYTLYQSTFALFKIITEWFIPWSSLFFVFLIGILLSISLIIALSGFREKPYQWNNAKSIQLQVSAILVASYIGLLIATTSIVHVRSMEDRYLAPIYVFIILLVFNAIGALAKLLSMLLKDKRIINIGVIFFCISWLIFLFYRSNRVILRFGNSIAWQESALIEWLKIHPLGGTLYSNYPYDIYIHSGNPATWSPSKNGSLPIFKKKIASDKHSYLIWFDNYWGNDLYSPLELGVAFDIQELVVFRDGKVYIFRSAKE